MGKKTIVISGVNLVDGGPISVFKDFLDALVANEYSKKYIIIALVSKKELFSKYEKDIVLYEFRKSKKSWVVRLYLEYFGFKKFSKNWEVDYWISMHDITPNVNSKYRYVYCHNPSPFNNMRLNEAKYGIKYYLFSKFYKYLYKINIKKNNAVIVQQEWLRKEFKKIYGIDNIIVARPNVPEIAIKKEIYRKTDKVTFIFPSFPRYYKNFQVACEAANMLISEGYRNFELIITLSGTENNYSKMLVDKYGANKCINFCGLLKREELYSVYSQSDCMLFLSKLESWGLPITEYKSTNNPMILSDLPYAHETVGEYTNVTFVNPNHAEDVKNKMKQIIIGEKSLGISKAITLSAPKADNWKDLCSLIFE